MIFNSNYIKCTFSIQRLYRKGQKYSPSDHCLCILQRALGRLELSIHILDRIQLIVLISYAGNSQIPKTLVSHYSV